MSRDGRGSAVALITFATFADILAYGVAVPVLPDIGRRFGASPTRIGLLFASFGLSVLVTSIPMGELSDRTGRRGPLVGGMLALAVASALFAFAPSMPWLFAARLVQGAADAVTWVVGFAVIADMYSHDERGRVMGLVMSGTTFGFMVGPSMGGWLYELGGPRLPYLAVAGLSLLGAAGLAVVWLPPVAAAREAVPLRALLRVRAVTLCAILVIVGGGTIAMLEPILALFLSSAIGLDPGRIGLVFGAGAVVTAVLHPVFGRVADRVGGRRLSLAGLAAIGIVLPFIPLVWSFASAIALQSLGVVAISMLVTPSLAYMADAAAEAGVRSFGVAYGLYNFAWALGLLVGPSMGGAIYERHGFATLMLGWSAVVMVMAAWLAWADRATPSPAI